MAIAIYISVKSKSTTEMDQRTDKLVMPALESPKAKSGQVLLLSTEKMEVVMKNHYAVTKTFVTGVLAGLTITEATTVSFEVGRTYNECAGSGSFLIVACQKQA